MCLVCESRATCRTPFLKSHQCNPYLPHHLFRFNQIPVVSKRVRDHAEENHHQQQNLCISWNTVKVPGRCRCYQSSHVSTLIVLNFKVITCSEKFDNGAFARSYSFKVIVSREASFAEEGQVIGCVSCSPTCVGSLVTFEMGSVRL